MRSIVCTEYGALDKLRLDDLPRPTLSKDKVRIKVNTVGINYVEGLMIMGRYQIKVPTPFVPGNDMAGVVTEVGASVKGVEVGQRVIVGYQLGALSEEVVASPWQLIPMPEQMSDAEGAVFTQSNATAYFGLVNCGHIQPEETVLVLGAAGATGMSAISIAKALGARVIAAASTEEKLAACRVAGADATINYETEDLKIRAKELTDYGVDMVFDPVGGELTDAALRACAPGARYLVIGFASGEIPKVPLNLPLLKRCNIVGVDWGGSFTKDASINPKIHAALMEIYQEGKLHCPPITEFTLENTAQAFEAVLNRKVLGRAVVRLGQNSNI